MNKKQIAEIVLDILETERFHKWYNNDFDDYITGDLTYKKKITHKQSKELILGAIEGMLTSRGIKD